MHIFPVFERKTKKTNIFKDYNINIIKNKKDNFVHSRNNTIEYRNKNYSDFKYNKLNNSKKNKYNHLSIEKSPSFKNRLSTEGYFKANKSPINKNRNIKIYKNAFTNTSVDLLYNREKMDDLFAKYRENVTNLQLLSNKKSGIKVKLLEKNIYLLKKLKQ